jgi:putative antitoxin of VapBC-like toxin-antitoxin system
MHTCMRTTLDIEDALLRRARRQAASEGRTLTAVIEDALRALLGRPARPARPRQRFRLHLPTRRGTRLPHVDIADRTALHDLLDPGR